jgi:4-hydroxyphenylpyruvate dioxygenase
MSHPASLGIERIAALGYYVHDLDRARRFFTRGLDFEEVAVSSAHMDRVSRQRGAIVRAGGCTVMLLAPTGEGSAAWRFLRKHPEGVGAVIFEVEDIARAFALLEARGGTPTADILRLEDDGGSFATFAIATPLGDTTFRFVERRGYAAPFPGFVARHGSRATSNRFGFLGVDHLTANFRTAAPAVLWMERVLGFECSWGVCFHTGDEDASGSGLKSTVMREPRSGVTLAANEPCRPRFRASQVSLFAEDHGGDGLQHAALTVADIVSVVRGLRERNIAFRPIARGYYERLPHFLARLGPIEPDVGVLRELGILVDGSAPGKYLLQIFLESFAELHQDPQAGPFFFEIIERRGDAGFGAGNFRALFESIEREGR